MLSIFCTGLLTLLFVGEPVGDADGEVAGDGVGLEAAAGVGDAAVLGVSGVGPQAENAAVAAANDVNNTIFLIFTPLSEAVPGETSTYDVSETISGHGLSASFATQPDDLRNVFLHHERKSP